MSKKNKQLDPKIWEAIQKENKKAKQSPTTPKKESSGDGTFDKAIQDLLKKKNQ